MEVGVVEERWRRNGGRWRRDRKGMKEGWKRDGGEIEEG